VDDSQRRELNKGLGDGFTRAFEIVLAPTVFALIGLWLDRALGTVPVIAVTLALLAVCGVFVKSYYVYAEQMREHEEGRPWAKSR
jgi:F0F1-type ATP synthase assembly protein I